MWENGLRKLSFGCTEQVHGESRLCRARPLWNSKRKAFGQGPGKGCHRTGRFFLISDALAFRIPNETHDLFLIHDAANKAREGPRQKITTFCGPFGCVQKKLNSLQRIFSIVCLPCASS